MKINKLINVDSQIEIDYLSEDNRDIKENTMFFCLKGANFDGHQAIEQVVKQGAKAIVHSDDIENKIDGIIYHKVDDVLLSMASIATKFYNNPGDTLNMIGITGTNGKTTTAWLLYDILNKLSSCGYIGTIAIEFNNKEYHNLYTTPKPIELNYYLAEMVEDKVKYCALEVSSHALVQHRAACIDMKYGIMTNLTFEHVNFHGSMEEYALAKGILFENLSSEAHAILNIDDITYDDYAKKTDAKVFSYGVNQKADMNAKDIVIEPNKTSFTLVVDNKEYNVETNLVAMFNVYNLMACLSVLYLEGYDMNDIIPLLDKLTYPQGRMEDIDEGQDFKVIVDYAHTPDGFEKVFEYAQTIVSNRVISVFGSAGGDRDREKRPILGELAEKYSDCILLTQEDNRTESVESVARSIASGIKNKSYEIIEKREQAIIDAIDMAQSGDVILILGKANDKYNVVGNEPIPYEGDIDLSRRLLK
ncbi:MAG: UDP-N-acetylmuramoyl-L-alanyl-D-glutamate--2,6-diaminopimelate ligase, partial [Erysipelotrichales bacterium]